VRAWWTGGALALVLAGGAQAAPRIEASLSRTTIVVGEASTLEIVMRGPGSANASPSSIRPSASRS
jgi:hypothetical protein